jgi:glyoxylase I family protein
MKRLAHICIFSSDLNRTLDFYRDILGLKKKFDFLKDGRLIGFYLEIDAHTFIEVFKSSTQSLNSEKQISHFCFEVSDIEAIRNDLVSRGVSVSEAKLGCDNSWQIWCKDPDGIEIEFHQYTSRSSQLTGQSCIVDW